MSEDDLECADLPARTMQEWDDVIRGAKAPCDHRMWRSVAEDGHWCPTCRECIAPD